jgi:benzoyl-CoA reductase subunit BamC
MCEDDPTLTEPLCVQVCRCGALTYAEWEEEVEDAATPKQCEMEIGLESLITRFGQEKVADAFAQRFKNSKR